jgi:hypothetical protein
MFHVEHLRAPQPLQGEEFHVEHLNTPIFKRGGSGDWFSLPGDRISLNPL